MGLRLTVPGVTFSRYVDIVDYPVLDQLSSLFYIGTDLASSRINHAADGANATGGANVTFNAGFGRFTGGHTDTNNCFVTSDLDNASADLTLITLVQREDTGNRGILGAYNGIANGASLENAGAYTGNGSLVGAAYAKPRPDDLFYFQAAVWSGTLVIPYTGIDGELVMGTPVMAERVQSANGMRVGGGYASGAWSGVVRISAAAKHTRALLPEELEEVYFYLRSRALKLGLAAA